MIANSMLLEQSLMTVPTPAYCYDLEKLRGVVKETKRAFAEVGVKLLFATMANDLPPILRIMSEESVGACVNSMKHLAAAIEAGIAPDLIQFTSSGISERDINSLHALRIATNLDSQQQIQQWFKNAPKAANVAGVRINAASLDRTVGWPKDRIGIDAKDVERIVASSPIVGLHVYLGTNFLSAEQLLARVRTLFELAVRLPSIRYINLGGGLGIDYANTGIVFPIHAYAKGIGEILADFSKVSGRTIDVYVEPGRALVADCGVYVSTITDLKEIDDTWFIVVDGSVASFPRPLHHPDCKHGAYVLGRDGATRTGKIVGRTTFSKDILADCELPITVAIGDRVIFEHAGAYSFTMSSRFLGQADPTQVFL